MSTYGEGQEHLKGEGRGATTWTYFHSPRSVCLMPRQSTHDISRSYSCCSVMIGVSKRSPKPVA